MKILKIEEKSLARKFGINPAEDLLEINGNPIRDFLDYRFHSAEESVTLRLKGLKGNFKKLKIRKKPDEDLGIILEELKPRACGNKCIFCFVDQLPKGLRRTLYFKDEDYRLSFLHGNFITLTNILEKDIERIFEQNISPFYVSVHTTDEDLRKRMLGNPKIPPIIPLIKRLTDNKIELHTQIVLCPGINDGRYLERSVFDLASFYPGVKSTAIVPVGLTEFRNGLSKISPVSKGRALEIVEKVYQWQEVFRRKFGEGFVYCGDELFLSAKGGRKNGGLNGAPRKAGLDIPPKRYYDDFYQIENGVGMVRKFLDDFERNQKLFPKKTDKKLNIILVTGKLAEKFIKEKAEKRLNQIVNLQVSTLGVRNDFLGSSITVSGLLSGRDILKSLKGRRKRMEKEIIILPPDCLNSDGLFLDDLGLEDLERELRKKIVLGSYDIVQTINDTIKK
jgi:putative radical SAM enzyme (TIGR03279 family)